MLLTLDMGNTNITLGVFKNTELLFESRIATDRSKMEDQYAVELLDIFRLYGVDPAGFEGAILSSVVPPLDQTLHGAVRKVTGVLAMQVGPGTRTGMNILIDNPATLGADLLVGAVAAVKKYGAPCLIWDLGTASKVSVVDKTGAFRGGAIMPGISSSLDSLITKASLLPRIRLQAPEKVVGSNTNDCMESGIVFGTAAMIEGMTARIEEELGYPVTVVGHRRTRPGGLRPLPAGNSAGRHPAARGPADHLRKKPQGCLILRQSRLVPPDQRPCGEAADALQPVSRRGARR